MMCRQLGTDEKGEKMWIEDSAIKRFAPIPFGI